MITRGGGGDHSYNHMTKFQSFIESLLLGCEFQRWSSG